MKALGQLLLIVMVGLVAFGSVLWNGAGFSHPDDVYAAQLQCCSFRPLLGLSYQMNARFGGWMLTNLALHLTAAILVFAVSRSVVAGAIFAAHPMAADAVASVAGRSALLLAVAVLAGVLFVRRFRWIGACVLVAGVVLTMGFTPGYFATIQGPSFPAHFIASVSALGTYVMPKMVVPLGLSPDPYIVPSTGGYVMGILSFPLTWPMLPFAFVPTLDVFLEHRAYLTLAWFAMVVGWALRRHQRIAYAIVPCLMVLAMGRAAVYSSPIALWEDAVRVSPLKDTAHIHLAEAYSAWNRYDDTERELEIAVRLNPQSGAAWKKLAVVKLWKNDPQGFLEIMAEKQELLKNQ